MKQSLRIVLTVLCLSNAFIYNAFSKECDCHCETDDVKWKGIKVSEYNVYFENFDISKHDQEFNGHTVEKHIGKSNDWLDGRLAGSRHEKFVSSYIDLETASNVIKDIVLENESKIKHWIEDQDQDKLILIKKYDKKIGIAMKKKDKELKDCHVGIVVLKRAHKTSEKFYIVTSYPVVNIGDVESEHKEWKIKNNDKYKISH